MSLIYRCINFAGDIRRITERIIGVLDKIIGKAAPASRDEKCSTFIGGVIIPDHVNINLSLLKQQIRTPDRDDSR